VRRVIFNMTYKIASWNVNSIKARLTHVQDFLATTNVDVLFLQELKGEVFPEISNDYHVTFKGQKAYNGVAILSRTPVTLIADKLVDDDTDEQARYLEVDWNGSALD
jgi:exodeoxyribonuclease-3